MLAFVVRRVLYSIPVLLLASILVFTFVSVTVDPLARIRNSRDPGLVDRERERLGLDRPRHEQYLDWAGNFVRGDWGESFATRRSVSGEIRQRLGNTVQLIVWGILFSLLVAVAIGVYSGLRQYSLLDYTFTGLSFVGLSMPPFFFALLAIHLLVFRTKVAFDLDEPLLFSVGMHSATDTGLVDYLRHLALPVLTLSVQLVAQWSRYQRSSMLDVVNADYIRTARAKGVPRGQVIVKHALRNALIPLTTIVALDVGALFGGLIITETIFSWPGMGQLLYTSLLNGDTNVLLPWLMVVAVFIVLCNLLADIVYGVLDPRIRLA